MGKEMTPKESLDLITRTILDIRESAKNNSFYFIAWGWIIASASIIHFAVLHYLLVQEKYELINWATIIVWSSFVLTGMIIQFSYQKKNQGNKKHQSVIGKLLSSLWIASGTGIILIVIFILSYGINPTPFVLIVTAIATYTTGKMIRFKPLVLGGIGFVLFAILALFINNHFQLLLNGAAIFVGYLIPGYMLKKTEIIDYHV